MYHATRPGAWPTAAQRPLPPKLLSVDESADALEPEAELREWVLVVDDHPDLLEMTKELLLMLGYGVFAAGSAQEALGILAAEARVSILFTDVLMPDMNGVELAEAAIRKHPLLHIVLTSGFPGDALKTVGEGERDFPLLLKPYSLSELKAALEY